MPHIIRVMACYDPADHLIAMLTYGAATVEELHGAENLVKGVMNGDFDRNIAADPRVVRCALCGAERSTWQYVVLDTPFHHPGVLATLLNVFALTPERPTLLGLRKLIELATERHQALFPECPQVVTSRQGTVQ